MIERKDKYIRIRVIGGSGIFDSIINILKKPIVSKLLTSAGKSVASVLGERLVNRMMPAPPVVASLPAGTVGPPATQQQVVTQQQVPLMGFTPVAPTGQASPSRNLPPASLPGATTRAQELISKYKAKQTPVTTTALEGLPRTGGYVPTIQEYVKRGAGAGPPGPIRACPAGRVKGAGIKEIL